jgi:hypothetical protein
VFRRELFFDIEHTTDWNKIHERKVHQVKQSNLHENSTRIEYEYNSGDKVLIRFDNVIQRKVISLRKGPYKILTVKDNGKVVIDKDNKMETFFYSMKSGGECYISLTF